MTGWILAALHLGCEEGGGDPNAACGLFHSPYPEIPRSRLGTDLGLHTKEKVAFLKIVFICHIQKDCTHKAADGLKKNTSDPPE